MLFFRLYGDEILQKMLLCKRETGIFQDRRSSIEWRHPDKYFREKFWIFYSWVLKTAFQMRHKTQ